MNSSSINARAMTTVEVTLELPDNLANAAKDAGLLAPNALEKITAEALRLRDFDELLSITERVEAARVPPLSSEELNAEIQSYRMKRRRAGG
jgi:hypothetical protein